MREFKFRAWIKIKKGFAKPGDISRYGFYTNNIPEWDSNDNISLWNFDDNVIYSQYTGLKDSSGKEIYEGDIVEFTVFNHNDIDTQYKGVVKYRSGLYEVWKTNDSEFFESDGAFVLNFVWLQDDEFKVIGNIFENSELLQ